MVSVAVVISLKIWIVPVEIGDQTSSRQVGQAFAEYARHIPQKA